MFAPLSAIPPARAAQPSATAQATTPNGRRTAPGARRHDTPAWLIGLFIAYAALLTLPMRGLAATGAPKPTEDELLFSRVDVPMLEIEIPAEGMEILRAYEFRKGSNPKERTNVAAIVRSEGRTYTNVAIHLKGSLGSFRSIDDRPSLTLSFDKWADGQTFHGLKKISLNSSIQDGSFASEQVARNLFRAAGLPCPRATHARVTLNRRPLGVHVLLEGWNKQFLRRHFPNVTGNLWDCGSAGDITNDLDVSSGENPTDRSLLDALIRSTQETNLALRLEGIGRILDLDKFYSLMAMEVMLVHWDGYAMNRNNYRVFHNRATDRLVFLPQGLDQMFGQFRHRPDSTITPMMRGLVARSIMQVPEGRRRYLERMEELFNRHYEVASLTNAVDAVVQRIEPLLKEDLPARARFMLAAPALKERMIQRAASVRAQLASASTPLRFGPTGAVQLTNWTSSRESGNPSFRRQAVPEKTIEIQAPTGTTRAYGSWRTDVYLDAGNYQLKGRLKIVDAEYGPQVTNGGASLRLSGEREAQMVQSAPDWRTVTYDFTVAGREDLTLVCEFRASKGRAIFDTDSLQLIRKPPANPDSR